MGKEGFHHLLGVGFGTQILSGSTKNDDKEAPVVFIADYTVHYNAITAAFDFGFLDDGTDAGFAFAAGAAWAMPMESGVFEPALRLQLIDLKETVEGSTGQQKESSDFGGDDGTYAEFALNYYMAGHDNKLQAALYAFTLKKVTATLSVSVSSIS